jgi:hypothetical protein
MRYPSIRWALTTSLALAGGAAMAEDSIKPGLWEITSQNSGAASAAMAQMQAQLAAMPPAQRAQIEAMMAKHGMSASGSNGGGMAIKACITPEMAQKGVVPVQQNGKCTTTSSRSGKTVDMSYTCATQPPSSGQGQITFDSDTSYTMKMHAVQNGMPVDMNMAGRWLGADCGSIKPAAQ